MDFIKDAIKDINLITDILIPILMSVIMGLIYSNIDSNSHKKIDYMLKDDTYYNFPCFKNAILNNDFSLAVNVADTLLNNINKVLESIKFNTYLFHPIKRKIILSILLLIKDRLNYLKPQYEGHEDVKSEYEYICNKYKSDVLNYYYLRDKCTDEENECIYIGCIEYLYTLLIDLHKKGLRYSKINFKNSIIREILDEDYDVKNETHNLWYKKISKTILFNLHKIDKLNTYKCYSIQRLYKLYDAK